MTIGTELDQAFYNLGQRITRLEKKEVAYPIENDFADKEMVLGIEAGLTSQIEMLESKVNESDFDDLESAIEDVRDSVSYNDDRIDEIEAYKVTEDEVEDIVNRMLSDGVPETLNDTFVEYSDYWILQTRVQELEARLNKPSLTARALRWLREGPSIKEVATNWYAGIRRGS